MKITVTGSLGNISRPLVKKLVATGHQVGVISSTPNRATDIETLGAIPLIGSVDDYAFITAAFRRSDAVYLMIPPNFNVPDYRQFTTSVGRNYCEAIRENGIQHVVNLSSVGSAIAGSIPLTNYQNLEEGLDQLPAVNVLHLRPGGFYTNFYGSIGLINAQGIMGNNFGGDVELVMSHPEDIADAAVEAFNSLSFSGKNVLNIVSDKKRGNEIAQILGKAIGLSDLKWVPFSDQQLLGALVQNGFSPDAAQHYIVDMGVAIREGVLEKYYQQNTDKVFGKRTFNEFAGEFAAVYQAINLTSAS